MRNHQQFVQQYKTKGMLIDANLLLMLVIGNIDASEVPRFKRTRQFSADNYHTLATFVGQFSRLITLPHVLTEVSNLAGQLDEKSRTRFFNAFREQIVQMDEISIDSRQIIKSKAFTLFGITDAAIFLSAKANHLVLTIDLPLYNFLLGNGVDAINFYHLIER